MLSENSLHADTHIIIIDKQLEMNNKSSLEVYFTYKTKAFPIPLTRSHPSPSQSNDINWYSLDTVYFFWFW